MPDARRNGAVLQGPTSQALAIKHVMESGGEIYALPS
jgi:hypothetical protein